MSLTAHALKMADATPPSRNRYVDFLRLISIVVVVLGHWLMAVIWWDNGLQSANLLQTAPWTQYATWILQVMPVFFFVGGYSNLASWTAHRRDGGRYGGWLSGRLSRLVRPALVFASVWTVLGAVLMRSPLDPEIVRASAQLVAIPLWFLAVYVLLVAIAPPLITLHRRFGLGTVAGMVTLAAAVDAAVRSDITLAGYLNYVLVWGAIHQLGLFWHEGRAPIGIRAAFLGLAGLAAIAALTMSGLYPVSMIGVPGDAVTNTTPPTIVLVALATWQFGLVRALEGTATRVLARREIWATVIAGNGMAMTMYLWHMTAMVLAAGVALALGGVGLTIVPDSVAWWVTRPVWFAALAIVLMPLVAIFLRFEARGPIGRTDSSWGAALAVILVAVGFAFLTLEGFVTSRVAALPVVGFGALAAGAWLSGTMRRART